MDSDGSLVISFMEPGQSQGDELSKPVPSMLMAWVEEKGDKLLPCNWYVAAMQ